MDVPLVAAVGHAYTEAFRANERLRLRYLVPPATEAVDCVLALDVDKRHGSSSSHQEGVMCEVGVLKHRDGAPGTVRLAYVPGCNRFDNWCEPA
jgi:replicative DNA helicase